MKNFKRIVALMIAILMVWECIPISAMADATGGLGGTDDYYTVRWLRADESLVKEQIAKEGTTLAIPVDGDNKFTPYTVDGDDDTDNDHIIEIHPYTPSGDEGYGYLYFGVMLDDKFTVIGSTPLGYKSNYYGIEPASINENASFNGKNLPTAPTSSNGSANWETSNSTNFSTTHAMSVARESNCGGAYLIKWSTSNQHYARPIETTQKSYKFYTVTYRYQKEGETEYTNIDTIVQKNDAIPTAPQSAERDGYKLTWKWNTTSQQKPTNNKVSQTLVATAEYFKPVVTYHYNITGGESSTTTENVPYNTKPVMDLTSIEANYTANGGLYKFNHWSNEPEGTATYVPSTETITEDKDYYAVYDPPHAVTFEYRDETTAKTTSPTYTIEYDGYVSSTDYAAYEGDRGPTGQQYKFTGWTLNGEEKIPSEVQIKDTAKFVAQYLEPHWVEFVYRKADTVQTTSDKYTIEYGENVPYAVYKDFEGDREVEPGGGKYIFEGWTLENGTDLVTLSKYGIKENTTFVAQYTEPVTVTFKHRNHQINVIGRH